MHIRTYIDDIPKVTFPYSGVLKTNKSARIDILHDRNTTYMIKSTACAMNVTEKALNTELYGTHCGFCYMLQCNRVRETSFSRAV
jgi:hypothetical protein